MNAPLYAASVAPEVRAAVEALNLRYLRALDAKDYQGWLDCFDDPASYVLIAAENEARGLPIAYMLDDSRARLHDRVTQITRIQADATEHYQPRHFTQLVDVQPLEGALYRAESHFSVYYTPADTGRSGLLVCGRYLDRVVVNGAARLRERRAVLDTNVVPRYVAYPV